MGGMLGFLFRQLTFTLEPLPESIRLDGKTAIITGANVGLGLEASKELARHGLSRVILGVRTLSKGETAKQEILAQSYHCDVQVWEVDQENWESMVAFAEKAPELERVDVVIYMGHEHNIQVNHLGTVLLSLLPLKPLKETAEKTGAPSRITIVSSEVHFWTDFDERKAPSILACLDEKDPFKLAERYNTSKLLNTFWMRELSNKVGGSVVVNAVNPGFCSSALHRSDSTQDLRIGVKIFAWTPAQGGHNLTYTATQHADANGAYITEQHLEE
ncbi:dehydrogenase [Pleomassaria siparia CBS 279.74]|uniref:Dehydrogenase n=1 Tax=Pleomassaria siparia CBS 279.74 TaxID=1314801 RepID=A0A6G1KEW9_9PLEO|nr:dehydrogenase [Pleomassaria siparia CBS 279.74]